MELPIWPTIPEVKVRQGTAELLDGEKRTLVRLVSVRNRHFEVLFGGWLVKLSEVD